MQFGVVKNHSDYQQVIKLLRENFINDPLYQYIFKQDFKDECLEIFFNAYLKYLSTSSKLLISNDKKACGVIFCPDQAPSKLKEMLLIIKFSWMLLPLIKYEGISGYIRCLQTVGVMSSDWIEEVLSDDYIHLDLMVVSQDARGKGYFKHWLNWVMVQWGKNKILTLETHNKHNVTIYKKCGFEVVKEIPLKNTALRQYCMVYIPTNNTI